MIIFTKHAKEKFGVLARHGFKVEVQDVLDTVNTPNKLDLSRLPLLIAQRQIDNKHVLRVVYKRQREVKKIITFYPGRDKKY